MRNQWTDDVGGRVMQIRVGNQTGVKKVDKLASVDSVNLVKFLHNDYTS